MLTNHLVLTVSGLPSDECPEGFWYVDAGLGDAMHEAIPLAPGIHDQGPYHLSIEQTSEGVGDWHLTHDPKGCFTGMSWRAAPASIAEFAERHAWLSTSPDSGFVRVVSAQRRDATGADILRGLTLTRVGEGAALSEPLTERDDWFDALADVFGLRFERMHPVVLHRLWDEVLARHEAWEAAGRP